MTAQLAKIEASSSASRIDVASRFGNFNINRDQVISMPQGLLGFADHQIFAFSHPDGNTDSPFKVFQSLRDSETGFLVLPLNLDNSLIQYSDLKDSVSAYNIEEGNLAILLVVTIRRGQEESRDPHITVNTQAPLIVDTHRKLAWQVVLEGNYTTRHEI